MWEYKRIVDESIKMLDCKWKHDHRGSLIEVLTNTTLQSGAVGPPIFGQTYVTTVMPGIIKGLHLHRQQTDRFMLLVGTIRFFGFSPSGIYEVGDLLLDLVVTSKAPKLIILPPMIWHGFQNIGDTEAIIINVPDKQYNHKEPDEVRKSITHLSDSYQDFFNVSLNG